VCHIEYVPLPKRSVSLQLRLTQPKVLEPKKCKTQLSLKLVEPEPQEPIPRAIFKAQNCCESLITTNADYIGLKSEARQMLNEMDDASVFYEDVLMGRLLQCAQLIRQIQKNPAPAKINQLKKNLMIKNMKKQKDEVLVELESMHSDSRKRSDFLENDHEIIDMSDARKGF
jgi:hypothetical protein